MFYSLFNVNKLDVVKNCKSEKECIDSIRKWVLTERDLPNYWKEDNFGRFFIDAWGFYLFSHSKEITEPYGTERNEIEKKYNITRLYPISRTICFDSIKAYQNSSASDCYSFEGMYIGCITDEELTQLENDGIVYERSITRHMETDELSEFIKRNCCWPIIL